MKKNDSFIISNKKYKSRLIIGTGKYKNFEECANCVELSGADIVTVAVRRVNIQDKRKPILMDYINPKKNYILTKYSWLFYIFRSIKNFKISKRDWWMETGKARSSWR